MCALSGLNIATTSSPHQIRATKPNWALGAKSSLTLKKSPAVAAPAHALPKAWGVSAADDADELMDDEELLTEEDKRPVAAAGEWGRAACRGGRMGGVSGCCGALLVGEQRS